MGGGQMKALSLTSKKSTKVLLILLVLTAASSFLFFQQPAVVVLKTEPVNKTFHNPFLPIVINFNRAPHINDEFITISPKTDVSIRVLENNQVQILPVTNFLPETPYTLTINTKPTFQLVFTTEQAGSNTPGWNEAVDKAHDEYQEKYGAQDAGLAEIRASLPIKEKAFSIDYSYANNTYTIILAPPYASNKAAFLAWLKQKGVTDLSTVRLKYINQ